MNYFSRIVPGVAVASDAAPHFAPYISSCGFLLIVPPPPTLSTRCKISHQGTVHLYTYVVYLRPDEPRLNYSVKRGRLCYAPQFGCV